MQRHKRFTTKWPPGCFCAYNCGALKGNEYKSLSKTIAHALRHEPSLYGIALDKEGWADINLLVEKLRKKYSRWEKIDIKDIHEMNQLSFKKRFEIKEDKIRALYGHSSEVNIIKQAVLPPQKLFHGTSAQNAAIILEQGLQAMERQFVHLSADRKTAWNVGKRKADKPVILIVNAAEAAGHGISFYYGSDTVWLADEIPPQFIIPEEKAHLP